MSGIHCQEKTNSELIAPLRVTLREALELNRREALELNRREALELNRREALELNRREAIEAAGEGFKVRWMRCTARF